MDEFCFSTHSKFESEYMLQWCQRQGMNPELVHDHAPYPFTIKVQGVPRTDARFTALILQFGKVPGVWHYDEECSEPH